MFNKIMEQFIELCKQFDGMSGADGEYGNWTFDLFIDRDGTRIFRITKKRQEEVEDDLPWTGPAD